jgi:UDP-glucose 4-epimerase
VNDLLAAIETLLARPVPRRYSHGRAFDVPVNVLDIRLADKVLGWQPRLTFEDALDRTLQWIRASK